MASARAHTPVFIRALLRLLPRGFREEFGEEMVQDITLRLGEAGGLWSRMRVRARAVLDMALTGLAERRRHRPAHRSPGGSVPSGQGPDALVSLARDLRHAGRGLRKDPVFALVAIVTLALGIGGATLSFSLVNGVLLRSLPFPRDHELATLRERQADGREEHLSFPNFDDWRSQSRAFQGIAALRFPSDQTFLVGGDPFRGTLVPVSREFFRVLGVDPWLGRAILPEENRPGGRQVAVVGYEFWAGALGSRTDLAALSITVGTQPYAVVGVMAPGFRVLEAADVYVPLELDPFQVRSSLNYRAIGRLAPGVTLAQAQVEMDGIARRIREAYPDDTRTESVALRPLRDVLLGETERPLWVLLGASTLLLLLACTNVASTLLARGTHRRREMAVRTALGAGRADLVRLVLSESFLLASAAGGSGVVLAHLTLGVLRSRGSDLIPRLGSVALDPPALLFALGATLFTVVLFGLLPALRASSMGDELRAGERGSSRGIRTFGWNVLVGGQAALAVVLVVASGLLLRSLAEIVSADTHFTADGVLVVEMDFSATHFASAQERGVLLGEIKEAFVALPGVDGVGLVSYLPDQGTMMTGAVFIPPMPAQGLPDPLALNVGWRVVDEDYFQVMGIPLVEGRPFSRADGGDAPPVIVLNEPVARTLFGDQQAVGRRVRFDPFWRDVDPEVVGVAAEARDWRTAPGEQPEGYVYWPQRLGYTRDMVAVIRTRGNPAELVAPVRERLRALAPTVPGTIQTLEARLAASFQDRSFTLGVLGAFALLSLLLAAVGIYGVVSYTVSARSREVGIRLALGAGTRSLRWRLFSRSAMTVAAGAAMGVLASLALGELMRSVLFQVSPRDPVALASAPVVLLVAAAVAIWIPVIRHTRVDPAVTMRAE